MLQNNWLLALGLLALGVWREPCAGAELPRHFSGIYPHLAMFNDEAECGTGAVVPWADRLWAITYGPHLPYGSSDRLYEITPALDQIIRPESVGGTHANRMIHAESQQLVIGPYLIDAQRRVRVISPTNMPGRLTGNARHLFDPANKIYFATMEEGLYEVDVRSLEVTGLIKDGHDHPPGRTDEKRPATISSQLPGYHGKGLYSGQGRVIYANNGEHDPAARTDPTTPSGALAEWRGEGDWQLVRRNQFTEVTGPGGLEGNRNPDQDPVWSIGWDHRSLILAVLDGGSWHAYRLPKASHCYDGAHGWNTEWPRIRDIGEDDLLMTMHGMFWRFPKTFSAANSAGLAPRSTYLKVIGDFCRWQDRIVFGCDDTAKNEFLNKRAAKGNLAGPGQSQSNLWVVDPDALDEFGVPLGRGAVWLDEPVAANEPSDAFLLSGFTQRGVHLTHDTESPVKFTFEVDRHGRGAWTRLREVTVAARGYEWMQFPLRDRGVWVRVRTDRSCAKATAFFQFRNADQRGVRADDKFNGIAQPHDKRITGALIRARGDNLRTLALAGLRADGGQATEAGYYEMDADLKLRRVNDPAAHEWLKTNVAIPAGVLQVDAASVLFVDDDGKRWRLPKGDPAFDQSGAFGGERVDREVCTERDLFNAHGTFYELPAENAGGFARIRPITTHNRRILDYGSYRGLLVLTGIAVDAPADNPHLIRSDDGQMAVWVGAVDDLWQFGKPRGTGGPWQDAVVKAGVPSDPYLMTGYDRKRMTLVNSGSLPVTLRVEVDISCAGQWRTYRTFTLKAGAKVNHRFPEAFSAYWVRVVADQDTTASATFVYE